MTEPVRDFVARRFMQTGKVWISAFPLRSVKQYHEVVTGDITPEMEDWIIENINTDGYYYCVENLPMFSAPWTRNHPVSTYWFFDDDGEAAMFKLMYGR